jgi:hypothetical protein
MKHSESLLRFIGLSFDDWEELCYIPAHKNWRSRFSSIIRSAN